MRRMIVLIAGLAALGGLMLLTDTSTDSPVAAVQARLGDDSRSELPALPPEPRFTKTMYAASDLGRATALLDKCKGPVAIWVGETRPTLISEHDYCGGSDWITRVKVGDAVKLAGDGVADGTFVVTKLTYETRHAVTVGDLPEADVVLQTCVTKTRLVLVGMERFDA